jgi:hypothetical protein
MWQGMERYDLQKSLPSATSEASYFTVSALKSLDYL